jgi:flavin-dependent dehydrogenase
VEIDVKDPDSNIDVVILGGGLAGCALAIQLQQSIPDVVVSILEKRSLPFPDAAHKVGESTIEVGAHYFTSVLDLSHQLRTCKLEKLGLRYFFNNGQNAPISERLEFGQVYFPPIPSYNFDRGRMENLLVHECVLREIDYLGGCRVKSIDLDKDGHTVTYGRDGMTQTIRARWVVDASGRAGILKRKLGCQEGNDHQVNSAWFRIDEPIEIDALSDDPGWQRRVPFRMRKFSTNHMMGRGYWVWFIPLVSGSISIGIVADAEIHPIDQINRFEKAMAWLHRHEPQCARLIERHEDKLLDFHCLKDFSYGCKQVFSSDRWALTGEAGLFVDPFYSPGSDFIAISNGHITALIEKDLRGAPIDDLACFYDQLYLGLYRAWMPLFQDQYRLMGNPLVMTFKTIWDFAIYWGTTALLYFHQKLHDQSFMQSIYPHWLGVFQINSTVQSFFREWDEVDSGAWCPGVFIDIQSVTFLLAWQTRLGGNLSDVDLKASIDENRQVLERLVLWMYGWATGNESEPQIDPYDFKLGSGGHKGPGPKEVAGLTADLNRYLEAGSATPVVTGQETRGM